MRTCLIDKIIAALIVSLCICVCAAGEDGIPTGTLPGAVQTPQTPLFTFIPTPTPTPRPTPTPLPVYDDTLRVEQAQQPHSMVAPEEMQVRLTLINEATLPVSDVRVCRENGSVICEAGPLGADDTTSYLFTEQVTPTDTQLNEGGIAYLIRYTLGKGLPGEAQKERIVTVPLKKLPAEPGIEFVRTIPVSSAKPGEVISIAYRVRNTGNVALTELTVFDDLVGEVGALERLDPGEKRNFICRYEVDRTVVSRPRVTYSYRSTRQTFEKDLPASTVYLASEALDITLDADASTVSPGGIVTLTYRIVNNGTVRYDRLRLTDQVLGELVNLPSELEPGQEYVFTRTVAPKETTTYLFTISGRSEGGSDMEAGSNPLTVAVTPAEGSVKLRLMAQAIDAPDGDSVMVRLTVRNEGSKDLRNVRVSEQEQGLIKTLAVAAPGDTVIEQRVKTGDAHVLLFMAELSDETNGRLTVLSNAVPTAADDAQADDTATPRPSSSPDVLGGLSGQSFRMSDTSTTFYGMMLGALGALILLTTCIAWSALNRKRRREKQDRMKMRRMRRGLRARKDENEKAKPKAQNTARIAPRKRAAIDRRPGSVTRRDG